MARIPYPDPEHLPNKDRALAEKMPPLNIFRMLSGSPALFQPMMTLFSAYLSGGKLEDMIREIVILRVGHLQKCAYELHQHERVARTLNMEDAWIAALSPEQDLSVFPDKERMTIHYVDEVVANMSPSDATFAAAQAYYSDEELIELTAVIGIYMMVCRLIETFEIDIEDTPIHGSGIEAIRDALQ